MKNMKLEHMIQILTWLGTEVTGRIRFKPEVDFWGTQ